MKNRIKDEFLASGVDSQKVRQQNSDECGKISLEDARKLYEQALKEQIIAPYTFPTKPSSDGFYHIYVADSSKKSGRRSIKAKNLETLKTKVFEHERGISDSSKRTFEAVFSLVENEKPKYVKDKEKLLSLNNTICKDWADYRRYFSDTAFAKKYVDEITKRDIETFCYGVLSANDLTKKQFLAIRSILKAVFKLAFEEYWISDNPYLRVSFKKYNDMLVKPTPIEERFHSEEEIDRMLAYIRSYQEKSPKYLAPYALELQIIMGLRRGEVPPLEWTDIKDGYILIWKEQLTVKKGPGVDRQYCQIVHHTKTWKDRKFPVTSDVQACLDKIRKVHDRYYDRTPFLFPNSKQTGAIHNNSVYNFYYKMCHELGIRVCSEIRKGTHSFRRNAITKVVNSSNGNIVMAAKLFGNTPEVADGNYYVGLDLEEARKILER